jgi:hypothetical protein
MPRAREFRGAYSALALIVFALSGGSSAFTILRPQRCQVGIGLSSNNDNTNSDGDIFFDDFGDGNIFGGRSSSDGNMSSLLSRMSEVKGADAAYDAKLARNWRRGNWSVRGFALDKSSSTSSTATSSSDKADSPVHVSVVAAPTSSFYIDSFLPQDSSASEEYTVAVGRTDGSVFIVQLGDQYLTNFVAVPKLVVEKDAGENDATTTGMVARVENEWTNSDQLKGNLSDDQQREAEMDVQTQSPFEIKHQFLASEHGEPINQLVFIDSIEGNDCGGIICAAAGSSGEISMRKLQSSNSGSTVQTQHSMLNGVHHDEIISLQLMVLYSRDKDTDEQNILFSASRDGTFALWNLDNNGELILSRQCADVLAGDGGKLTCADVFNPSSWGDDLSDNNQAGNDVILLGTSNGYVVGYRVLDLLANSTDTNSFSPSPNLRYRAHGMESGKGESVTAIKCGGDGTIVSSARLRATDENQDGNNRQSPRTSSFILLTGGEDGSVKQWCVITSSHSIFPLHYHLIYCAHLFYRLHQTGKYYHRKRLQAFEWIIGPGFRRNG